MTLRAGTLGKKIPEILQSSWYKHKNCNILSQQIHTFNVMYINILVRKMGVLTHATYECVFVGSGL